MNKSAIIWIIVIIIVVAFILFIWISRILKEYNDRFRNPHNYRGFVQQSEPVIVITQPSPTDSMPSIPSIPSIAPNLLHPNDSIYSQPTNVFTSLFIPPGGISLTSRYFKNTDDLEENTKQYLVVSENNYPTAFGRLGAGYVNNRWIAINRKMEWSRGAWSHNRVTKFIPSIGGDFYTKHQPSSCSPTCGPNGLCIDGNCVCINDSRLDENKFDGQCVKSTQSYETCTGDKDRIGDRCVCPNGYVGPNCEFRCPTDCENECYYSENPQVGAFCV